MKRIRAVLVLFAAIVLLVVGCSGGTPSPAEPLFRQADELEQAQDYEGAIQVYERIREQYPGTFDASYASERIAWNYESWAHHLKYGGESNYEKAIEKLEIIIEQYPDTDPATFVRDTEGIPEAYFEWARNLRNPVHDYQSALEKYQIIVSQYPQSDYAAKASEAIPACYQEWGDYLSREENYLGAIEKYEILLSEYRDSEPAADLRGDKWGDISWAYYKVAQRHSEEGNYDAAIDSYQAILERWSQSVHVSSAKEKLPTVYLAKASELEREEDWAEAFDIYQKILTQFPKSSEAHEVNLSLIDRSAYEYGRLLQSQGRYEEAIEKYEISGTAEAIEALWECYYLSAQHLAKEGKYREALEKYVTILNDYPNTIWASWERDEILRPIPSKYLYDFAAGLGVSEAAMRLYQAILDYHPGSDYIAPAQKAMVDIGIALITEGEYGTLPPATREGSVAAGGTAVIEVRNGTPYTLIVLFKGPDTKVVYLKPNPDAGEYFIIPYGGITEYTTETINLTAGAYQIGARVSKTSIDPWYGTDTFQSNEQYSEVFYIHVTYG